MIGKCFFVLTSISLCAAIYNGRISELSQAVLDGAGEAVEITVALLGMMCLWCGIIEVLRDAGTVSRLSRLLSPLLRRAFPDAYRTGVAVEEICAAVAANMLGIANAATPFALAAMERLDRENPMPERESDDMVTLSVLGASSVSLLPTTVISLLHAEGSASPYSVIVPIWICSSVCTVFVVVLSRLTRRRGGSR